MYGPLEPTGILSTHPSSQLLLAAYLFLSALSYLVFHLISCEPNYLFRDLVIYSGTQLVRN